MSRRCKEYERVWRDLCVDRNLQDEWLEHLNSLKTLNLVGICEGHPDRSPGSSGRFPQINLRLKASLLPGIAGRWNDLRAAMLSETSKLFQSGDMDVRIELKFWLRTGRGKLIYQEDLTVRVRGYQARDTAEMDAKTYQWFERAVERVNEMDRTVWTWHGQQLDV